MKTKLIVNADDLGLVPEVNAAIFEAFKNGYLTHASFMANMPYFQQTLEDLKQKAEGLKIGVHVNLTCGTSLSKSSVLSHENGAQKQNFLKILFLRKTKKTLQEIENEIESQILKIKNAGINISHIDGHEHIHIIPSINKIVKKLANKHQIERVREINESFLDGLKFHLKLSNLTNFAKWLILKTLSLFNSPQNPIGFYSIFSTCKVSEKDLFQFLEHQKKYKTVEIMLHPSLKVEDKHFANLDARFITFLKSQYRTQEYELCFNSKFSNYDLD